MKITKELKFGKFVWDQEQECLLIWDEYGNKIILRKNYIFSLLRFCVRISQRYFNKGIRGWKTFEAEKKLKDEEQQ